MCEENSVLFQAHNGKRNCLVSRLCLGDREKNRPVSRHTVYPPLHFLRFSGPFLNGSTKSHGSYRGLCLPERNRWAILAELCV